MVGTTRRLTDQQISRSSPEIRNGNIFLFRSAPTHQPTSGRRNRDRTCDIHRVKVALYQLSYPPVFLSNVGGCYQVHPALSTDSRTLLAVFLRSRSFLIHHRTSTPGFLFLETPDLPGEKLSMDLLKPAPLYMRVDLRRGNVRMAQHRLHRA